jgi:two-component system phosphate regulon sensor histidine kinase PhoR
LRLKNLNEKSIWVEADEKRIQQVFTNLLVNSINYGKDGGETRIRFYDMDDNILIEVADNGLGIAKEHLPRIFERFYRVDKSRSRNEGGSGLGLAICKHIIEAHKQTISVRSTEAIGSTFAFTLKKTR